MHCISKIGDFSYGLNERIRAWYVVVLDFVNIVLK